MCPPGKGLATVTSEGAMKRASISPPSTPITSNSQGEAGSTDAQTQPLLSCARRRGSHPHPAILPRSVPAHSRSPPPRLPSRLLGPRDRSRAHPTPRLRACSITVLGAGLQASPSPELFEYANKRLEINELNCGAVRHVARGRVRRRSRCSPCPS